MSSNPSTPSSPPAGPSGLSGPSGPSGLEAFHPLIQEWFRQRFPAPTDIQQRAWPVLSAGEHALLTAPTGSGKTLTAFLWPLNQLLTGAWRTGGVRALYVSPLKALNYDIQRNLAEPLEQLQGHFAAHGEEAPEIRVLTRSGDTPARDRQRMVRRPPEILITTPESLNILLTSQGGQRLLGGLETVIVDEIHAVAGGKRGVHLITAVDRLVELTGDFQRVGISATVKPLERIAQWFGGWHLEPESWREHPLFRRRPVTMVRSRAAKAYDLAVQLPRGLERAKEGEELQLHRAGQDDFWAGEDDFWPNLAGELRDLIRTHRSSLIFANSRRMTEKLTRLINEDQNQDLAYSHHGSLSREIRSVVEQRLKEGRLPAIVATNSLELGIDIGDLDQVVLVQTPPAVSSAVQRIGRAGHRVGEVSKGRFYPLYGRDFLDAAVVARCVREHDLEPLQPVYGALDVLAQVLVSMVAQEAWPVERLYAVIRTSEPYHHLSRRHFDLVLEMLAGRYADSRVRDLDPRISIDRVSGTVRGRPGAARLVYMAGGTIPDRGYYHLRLQGTGAKLGELDEEFVWERSLGDTFSLGAQSWRVQQITHNDVLVTPSRGAASLAPFWRAEERDRDAHLSTRIGELLEEANRRLEDPRWPEELTREHALSPAAADSLLDLLRRQRQATGADLPHRHHLLVEHFRDPTGGGERRQVLLHTFWGGRVNRPLAIALAAAWHEAHAHPLEIVQDDDCINLILPAEVPADDLLQLITGAGLRRRLEELLRRRLETTGFFGARFRENAARALLLPRGSFKKRMPLWLNRARSKKLLTAVSQYEDFPMLVETWRTCLQDEFDLDSLEARLDELIQGEIRVGEVWTETPSPFAEGLIWKQTNRLMYEDDTPEGAGVSRLRPELLQEVVFSSHLRPRLAAQLVADFEAKAQRLAPGYAPRNGLELLDWLEERLLIPLEEWAQLLEAARRDTGDAAWAPELVHRELKDRALALTLPGGGPAVVSVARLPRLLAALGLTWEQDQERLAPAPVPGLAAPGEEALGGEIDAAMERSGEEAERIRAGASNGDGEDDKLDGDLDGDPLTDLVADWLRFYGPREVTLAPRVFGLEPARWATILETLVEERRVVVDQLVLEPGGLDPGFGAPGPGERGVLELCDAENLEILLRRTRAAARPAFEPLPPAKLPLLLAVHQRLGRSAGGTDDLRRALEPLFGLSLPVALWEQQVLPARLAPYFPSWLDGLLHDTELGWFGTGRKRVAFALEGDLELFQTSSDGEEQEEESEEASEGSVALDVLFPPSVGRGRFELPDLQRRSGWTAETVQSELWRLAWSGQASTDTFAPVRRGLALGFGAGSAGAGAGVQKGSRRPGRPPRGRRQRGRRDWSSPRPAAGAWSRLPPPPAPEDALEAEELNKDRARQLLDRYGIVFRQLLDREAPALRWSAVFRSLRLMELSGEVLAGRFFTGVDGLQFISHRAFRRLLRGLPEDRVFWVNAADPASLCGVAVDELKAALPSRRPSHHVVYHGSRVVVVSRRNGRRLDIRVAPEEPSLMRYLDFLKTLLGREVEPRKALEVAEINGEDAAESPYLPVLASLFSITREPRGVRLRKRYGAAPALESSPALGALSEDRPS
ncbi:MAG: DEAD/DEAH box helicase [Acidobacteriota bacterium]|nr:DEAD/DEAH box helicase [Acidobacteriota bacterium]